MSGEGELEESGVDLNDWYTVLPVGEPKEDPAMWMDGESTG